MKAFVIVSTAKRESGQLHLETDDLSKAKHLFHQVMRRKYSDVLLMDGYTGEILRVKCSKELSSSSWGCDYISESYRQLNAEYRERSKSRRPRSRTYYFNVTNKEE